MAVWISKVVKEREGGRSGPAEVDQVLDPEIHGAEVTREDYNRLCQHFEDRRVREKNGENVGKDQGIEISEGRKATIVFGNHPEKVVILGGQTKKGED